VQKNLPIIEKVFAADKADFLKHRAGGGEDSGGESLGQGLYRPILGCRNIHNCLLFFKKNGNLALVPVLFPLSATVTPMMLTWVTGT